MIGRFEHVVLGVDGTLASDEACRVGCAQAALYGLPLSRAGMAAQVDVLRRQAR
jgi:hypothetical protein